ncbi:hypothetical protein ACHAXT_002139, partial [Thalassiosira profunda]
MLSPRAAFLAGLARRRIDDDDGSDSDCAGTGEEYGCGDESSVDTAALLQKSTEVTPPRAHAALREMERLLKATPPDRADKSASVLGRRRSGLRGARKPSPAAGTASKQSAKPQLTAKASPPPPPPPPLTRMSPSSSPLLRRAESRRRRAKDADQAENKSAIGNVGTPPRKGAHHVLSSKVAARSTPPRAGKGRPVLEIPSDLTSSNSSSYEGEEDDVMSVLSTASILKASSTVETAPLSASYCYSISHSKSSGSSGSRKISAAIKKVESIGGLKSKGSGSDDDASLVESLGGSVVTSEGYEVSLVRSESSAGRASGKAKKQSNGSYRGTKTREQLDFKDYCATRIQAAVRGYLGFTSFMDSMSRIIMIQSVWRMQIQRKRYHRLVEEQAEDEAIRVARTAVGATKIQSCWRRHLASEYFIFVLSDVIVCQSVARRKIALQNYRETLVAREASATLIQKMYRGFTQRMEYIITITDILTIQSVARQFLAKRELQAQKQLRWAQEFVKKEDAATKIQASYVGYITRMDYLISISNIILCQSVARRVIAGGKLRKLQHEQKEQAATKIRAAYLGYLSRIEYCITISDVITIQSRVRGIIAKREAESRRQIRHATACAAATKISSAFRGYVARVDFIVTICNVVTVQSVARKWIAQRELEKLRHEERERAATKIRAVYLGYTARLDFMFTVADITTMQRCFRGHRARGLAGQMRRTRDTENATKIQAAARGMIAKRAFKRTKGAAITIQKTHRAFVAYESYVVDLANIMYTQAIVRKFLAKKELTKKRQQRKRTNECAASIQTCWRSYKAQTDFALTIWGVITLQALVRRRLQARRYDQLRRIRDNECATTIQTCWRSYKAETDFSLTIWGIISLQSLVRRRLQARRYAQMRWGMAKKNATRIRKVEIGATTMIQSCFRGYLAKCERKRLMHEEEERARQADIAKRNAAATAIQSCWRGYREFVRCLTITYSIVQIQTWARGCEARRQLQIRRYGPMRLQHAAATAIQTCFRGYCSFLKYAVMQYFVVKIQAAVRRRQGKRRAEQMRQFELEQRRKNPIIYAISKAKRKSLPSQRNRVPSAQNLKLRKLREKRAALTIERFFMRIKAEIELEMMRLEERESNRKKGKKKRHSERGGSQRSVSSAYSFSATGHRWDAGSRSGSAATVATPSHVQHPAWMGSPNAQNYHHQHPMRSPSLSIERVPSVPSLGSNSTMDAFVRVRTASPALQKGGYNNAPPCNEAHRKSPPPSGYGHRPHPNFYPQSGGNSMKHPGAYGLHQSRSFASTASHHAPNPLHLHQRNNLPSSRSVSGMQQQPSAPYPMAGTGRYSQHQMHNTPVGGHYAMPQKPPAQRQTQAP